MKPQGAWRFGLPYAGYLAAHLILSPVLAIRALMRAKRRGYSGTVLTRLLGGSGQSQQRGGILLVAGGLGEARVAAQVARELAAMGERATVLVQSKEGLTASSPDIEMGFAPFNSPISAWLCLRRWHPKMVWAVEFWDNHHMKALCRLQRIPTLVFNVPITEVEADRVLGSAWKYLGVDLYAAQEEAHAARLRSLGVPDSRVVVTGPAGVLQAPREAEKNWLHELGIPASHAPIVLAGSTYEEDESVVLDARRLFPEALLILAPRRLARAGGPASVLEARGDPFVRRSERRAPRAGEVILLDSYGELKDLYSIADVAFIGGTFQTEVGGHTPVEALAYGVPVTLGPHFAQQTTLLVPLVESGFAVVCQGASDLAAAWRSLSTDASARTRAQAAGRAFQERSAGIAALLLEALRERTAE